LPDGSAEHVEAPGVASGADRSTDTGRGGSTVGEQPTPAVSDATAPAIDVRGVSQIFRRQGASGASTVAIEGVELRAMPGEFVSIVGPSGCGKSTLLGLISGLTKPSAGTVSVKGEAVRSVRQDVGFIFQKDALLPWMTVLDNVALALKYRGVARRERNKRSREWLAMVGLSKFAEHYPHQLSGGMRKRVAIASTLVYEPSVLLMDEPFSALDVQTRNTMENDLLRLWQDAGHQTVVFVTHDLEEAIGMSDRVIVMSASPGRVIGDYAVDLPRPRDLLEVRMASQFTELYAVVWDALREEVHRAQSEAFGRPDDHEK
jgi:NitT/TauT family transport system ATP-binding protein